METMKLFVRELFKEERVFMIDPQFLMKQFLEEAFESELHHYQRTFFSIENNCFVDLDKTFQENHIVSFDHLLVI